MAENFYIYGNNYYYNNMIPEEFENHVGVKFAFNCTSTSTTPIFADCTVYSKSDFLTKVQPNIYKLSYTSFPWKFYIMDTKETYLFQNGNLYLYQEDFHV